jgi:hypothetical protein
MSIQSILSYVNPFHINANEAVNLSSMPQKQKTRRKYDKSDL